MIDANKIVFEYTTYDQSESVKALDNVSIKIKKGEFVVIIGHNGSGKSTFAKMINGILVPLKGNIFVDQMNTADESLIWEIRKKAGMIFQNPDNQIVATIVEDDVAFGPENLAIESGEIRKRVDNALTYVNMIDYKSRPSHMLSGGQKQRIAIAGILAMQPECIILDEPTAMLDPEGRKEVLSTIHRLNQEENITIVHITHFMDEAVNADRIIVMDKGKVVMSGTPREVFSKVDELKTYGLEVPQVTQLAHDLQSAGVDLNPKILTVDEMVNEICQLL